MQIFDAQYIGLLMLVVCMVIASGYDLREHRVPNWISGSVWVVGVLLAVLGWQAQGLPQALAGGGIVLAILLPAYAFGGIGAGDVKLMSGAGLFLGALGASLALAIAFVAGGCVVLMLLLSRYLARQVRTEAPSEDDAVSNQLYFAGEKFPFAPMLTLGTAAAVMLTHFAGLSGGVL